MSVPTCKFYLQGNCHYGSSCRFLHSDDRGGRRPNSQYYDEYRPNYNRYESKSNYANDQYEQNNYQSSGRGDNYHWKKNSNHKNNYNQRSNHYEDDYNSSYKYDDDYDSVNRYQSKKNYGSNNYYQDAGDGRNNNYDHKHYNTNNYDYNNQEKFTSFHKNHSSNRYNDTENQFTVKHNQANDGDRNRKLKIYENEIKTYQTHTQELINSNIWPFTCYHPVGNVYPIQPVGSLNFIEVSYEEIRCDYYISKSACAAPELIHKRAVEDLTSKALQLKADVISLRDRVLDDIIVTLKKCEESKTNNMFVNTIQADNNSYWDMSVKELGKHKNTSSEIDSFSFVPKNDQTNSKNVPTLKILLQNEVYGNMDCDAFAQENFTDYIPIMPPPRKYCI